MLRTVHRCLAGVGLALAFGALPTPAQQPPAGDAPPPVVDLTPPDLPGRRVAISEIVPGPCNPRTFLTSAEYLLVRPRRRDLDFAIVDPIDDLAPQGKIKSADWPTVSGLRAGIGYRPADSLWEAMFTYTYLFSGDDRTAAAPPGGVLYPTLTRPGVVDRVQAALAGSGITFNVFDLESGRRFQVDDSFAFRLFSGARWASVDQSLNAYYFGGDADRAHVRSRIEFDGAGVTVGGQGDWIIGRGFRLFGRARGSLLVGDFCTRLTETDQGGRVLNADVREHFVQTVPVLEIATGISWEYRNFKASVGYEVANWFNLADTPFFVDDLAEGKFGRRRGDVSLEGVFFQLGLAF
jgi:Legionella pneumophila major outer membrane protein precursor